MSKTIPPLDLMWLAMETSAAPTHVGALMLFEKPKGRPRVVREIVDAYRAVRPTPPFNYVPDLGGGVPKFHETTDYDPCYHVQYIAMPADASYVDFLRVVTDLHEPMLDRARPLFRAWVIDGVPGGRFAIYSKVHHAIIDGASGTRRIYASLSASPRDPVRPPAFGVELAPRRPRASKGIALGVAFKGQNVAFMVGLAFAIAASANFPALVLSVFWRRMSTAGAASSMIVGTIATLVLIVLSPAVQVDLLHKSSAIFPLKNPALVTIPLAFLTGIVVSLLSPEQSSMTRHAALQARMLLGEPEPTRSA